MGKSEKFDPKKKRKKGEKIVIRTPAEINATTSITYSQEIVESAELRKIFAKTYASSLSILTEPCQVCQTDVDPVTGKYRPDPTKPFMFACVGVLDRDGSVNENELFVVSTQEIVSTTVKKLVFNMTPDERRVR